MRVLVRTPNWLGDLVMALPVFTALRADQPDAVIAAGVPAALAPLVAAVGSVDEVWPVERRGDGLRHLTAEANAFRPGRFDRVLLLPNSFGSAWAARRAGIPERWGYAANWRRPLLTRAAPRPRRATPPLHLTGYYQALLRALGIEPAAPVPRLAPTPKMAASAEALLEGAGVEGRSPLIGIAPGAAYGHAKRWLPDRYARVVTRLVQDRGAQVVLVGSGHDRDAGHAIESSLASELSTGTDVTNLIGRTDLSQLVGLLARCEGFISSDSGAMHLAAALGVRVTAIFGPTDERLTAPVGSHAVLSHSVWCRPCFFRDCPIDHRCMTGITADQVFEAVAGALPPGRGTS